MTFEEIADALQIHGEDPSEKGRYLSPWYMIAATIERLPEEAQANLLARNLCFFTGSGHGTVRLATPCEAIYMPETLWEIGCGSGPSGKTR